jgi:malic enzyme
MHHYQTKTDPATGEKYLPVRLRGQALMTDPMLNKGTAFTREERAALGIQGLIPPSICTIEKQLERVYENYRLQPGDLDRYLYLAALQDRNETLFYRLLSEHVEEMTPIIYTPTVGLACERFSHIYRRPRGLYITPDDSGRMRELLSELPYSEVSVIVATDGEGILGLGDLAGVLGVCTVTGRGLADHRFVVHGAGAGGGGIIQVLLAALSEAGLSAAEARARVVGLDSRGLILANRPGLEAFKHGLAADPALVSDWRLDDPNNITLNDVVANFQPTVLIGTSGQPGCFTEAIIREMVKHVERPAIFALSNPTSKTEVLPTDALAWTDGRALVATGSPFEPVVYGAAHHRIGQGNNVFCFPGIGLGVIAARARCVSDGMLLAAARAVADEVSPSSIRAGCVYPEMEDLHPISRAVALAVAQTGISEGVAEDGLENTDAEAVAARVDAHMWYPNYLAYRDEPDA